MPCTPRHPAPQTGGGGVPHPNPQVRLIWDWGGTPMAGDSRKDETKTGESRSWVKGRGFGPKRSLPPELESRPSSEGGETHNPPRFGPPHFQFIPLSIVAADSDRLTTPTMRLPQAQDGPRQSSLDSRPVLEARCPLWPGGPRTPPVAHARLSPGPACGVSLRRQAARPQREVLKKSQLTWRALRRWRDI